MSHDQLSSPSHPHPMACHMGRARAKLSVRIISVSVALLCVVAYSQLVQRKQQDSLVVEDSNLRRVRARGLVVRPRVASEAEDRSHGESQSIRYESRHLLDAGDAENCSKPREGHPGYNSSCSYVLENCMADYDGSLFNYLTFVLCDLSSVQVSTPRLQTQPFIRIMYCIICFQLSVPVHATFIPGPDMLFVTCSVCTYVHLHALDSVPPSLPPSFPPPSPLHTY